MRWLSMSILSILVISGSAVAQYGELTGLKILKPEDVEHVKTTPPPQGATILFNGKEGRVGLMPPLGTTLSDEQIAAVLTYVRREWGQAGTPIDAASVKETRTATAGRLKPWTDAELQALIGGK